MEQRPKIRIEPTNIDKIVEIFGIAALIFLWYLSYTNYADLPETIPVHFNGSGKADGFGNKETILVLPLIATVIFIVLTILNFFPHIYNYPGSITEENAEKQYRIATQMMRSLKIIVVLLFTLIVYKTQQISKGAMDDLGQWFILLVFALFFIPIFYFLTQMSKNS